MIRIVVTAPARQDIQSAYEWWALNRSEDQAIRWYDGIYKAIDSLKKSPGRCSRASESELLDQDIRQLLYGLSANPTHRILFAIDERTVVILRVRHTSQDALTLADLT